MVRARVRDLFDAYYPGYRSEEAIFREHVAAVLRSGDTVVLDGGCGSGEMCDHDLRQDGRAVIGIDEDVAVATNPWVTWRVRGRLDALPLPACSVDVVVCRYVFEHLDEPRRAVCEIARVLRPNGRLVFLTPNAFHYVTLISRLTPTWFHRWLNKQQGVDGANIFPTYYRANTTRAINALARASALNVARIELVESSPNYLEFSRVLYRFGIAYERIASRFRVMSGLRVNIVATLTKTPVEEKPGT